MSSWCAEAIALVGLSHAKDAQCGVNGAIPLTGLAERGCGRPLNKSTYFG